MNKEEILLRNKNDNRKGDELEKKHDMMGELLGLHVADFVLCALYLFDLIKGTVQIGTISMDVRNLIGGLITLQFTVELSYRYYHSKKKWQLACAIIFGVGLVFGLLRICHIIQ